MRAAAILSVVLFVACGDGGGGANGPDLTGIYTVTHHTFAQANGPSMLAPCATEGPAATTPPFFRIEVDPAFGPGYEECTTSDGTMCGFALYNFHDGTDTGWQTKSSNTQQGGGTDCTLYHEEYTAEQQADGSVRIEAREWADFMPSECTLSAADKLSSQPMCQAHEVVVGTLVQ